MIGYKIVTEVNGKYYSYLLATNAYSNGFAKKVAIEYKIGEFAKPRFGRLYFFKYKSDTDFASPPETTRRHRRELRYKVFKCEASNPACVQNICYYLRLELFESWWKRNRKIRKEYSQSTHGMGVYTASAIKLIEEVAWKTN